MATIQTLFSATLFSNTVVLLQVAATPLQAIALAQLLARTRKLGTFGERRSLDGSKVELHFPVAAFEKVQDFLTNLTADELSEDVTAIEQVRSKQAIASAETERINSLSIIDFGALLSERSAGKLNPIKNSVFSRLELTTAGLLPVTHFKTLARLTSYDAKARLFTVAASQLCDVTRDKLLELADKLARSTKKVTAADVTARKVKRLAKQMSHEELEEQTEDLMLDLYGYKSAETWQLARESILAGPGVKSKP